MPAAGGDGTGMPDSAMCPSVLPSQIVMVYGHAPGPAVPPHWRQPARAIARSTALLSLPVSLAGLPWQDRAGVVGRMADRGNSVLAQLV